MKVSVTGLALASLCGSALAAPVSVNAEANVGTAVDTSVNTNINSRDILGNALPVEGATGDLTNVDGLEQKVTGVLGSTGGGVLGRDILGNALPIEGATGDLTNVEGLASGNQLTDGQKLANLDQVTAPAKQLVQQLKGSAGGIAARDVDAHVTADINSRDINANVDAVVGKLVDAKVDAVVGSHGVKANVDAQVGSAVDAKVNTRSTIPEGTVTNTVAYVDPILQPAADIVAMDTAKGVSSGAGPVDHVAAGLFKAGDGILGRKIPVVESAENTASSATGFKLAGATDSLGLGNAI